MSIPHKVLIVADELNAEQREATQKELSARIDAAQVGVRAKHPPYHYARSKDEWWAIVDEYWAELLHLASYELNLNAMADPQGRSILRSTAEAPNNIQWLDGHVYSDHAGNGYCFECGLSKDHPEARHVEPLAVAIAKHAVGQPLVLVLDQLRKDRSNRLQDLFQSLWAAAPDTGDIHARPAWGVLCDLCSEAYVLYEGPQL